MPSMQSPGVVLVTGGTGAIGSAVCQLLAASGHNVAFTYRKSLEASNHLLAEIRATGSSALSRALELTNAGEVASFVDEVSKKLGPISSFVHAGGPFVSQHFVSHVEPGQMSRHLEDEVIGFFHVARACLSQLRANHGSIVAVTTVATRRFPKRDVLSSAPKAAIEALVRAIASEEGRFGVRANCVGPGILSEGMAMELIESDQFDEAARERALDAIPLHRFGTALDVAQLVSFLVSERSTYISGQMIDVDGGYAL